MPLSLLALFGLQIATALLLVILMVQGFRTHAGWGLCPLVIVLGPFAAHTLHIPKAYLIVFAGLAGLAVFAIKHRKRAGILFVLYLTSLAGSMALLFTSPPAIAFYARFNPEFASIIKAVNPLAYDEAQKLPRISLPGLPDQPQSSPASHEVRDLAENEEPPPTDPNAAQRAAYVKHMNELNSVYLQLDAERQKLKTGAPGVAAFNVKAARYQKDVQALAEEKTRLNALDRASNVSIQSPVALASSQDNAVAPGKPQTQP